MSPDFLLRWRVHYLDINHLPAAVLYCIVVSIASFFVVPSIFGLLFAAFEETFRYLPHNALVKETRVSSKNFGTETGYRPEVRIAYKWEEKEYEIWTFTRQTLHGKGYSKTNSNGKKPKTAAEARASAESSLSGIRAGQEMQCFVNTSQPGSAVLQKSAYPSKSAFLLALYLWILGVLGFYLLDLVRKRRAAAQMEREFRENPENWMRGSELAVAIAPCYSKASGVGTISYFAVSTFLTLFGFSFTFYFVEFAVPVLLMVSLPVFSYGIARIAYDYNATRLPVPLVEMEKQPLICGEETRGLVIQHQPHRINFLAVVLTGTKTVITGSGKKRRVNVTELARLPLAEEQFGDELHFHFDDERPQRLSFTFRTNVDAECTRNSGLSGKNTEEVRWAVEIEQRSPRLRRILVFPFVIVKNRTDIDIETETD